ncbi:hypothetical protein [Arthrobacter psychrolactophilus]
MSAASQEPADRPLMLPPVPGCTGLTEVPSSVSVFESVFESALALGEALASGVTASEVAASGVAVSDVTDDGVVAVDDDVVEASAAAATPVIPRLPTATMAVTLAASFFPLM